MKLRTSIAAALMVCLAAASAQVVIPESSSAGAVPGYSGAGLNADFWNAGPFYGNGALLTHMGANAPLATFRSTLIDYAQGDVDSVSSGTPLSSYLGTDAPSLTPASEGSNVVETSLMRFHGYIAVHDSDDTDAATPGIDVRFELGSDDGSGLWIGGQYLIDNGGDHGFRFAGATARFERSGLYPVMVVYNENYGSTGIEWYSSIAGGPNHGAPNGTVGLVPTARLYDVVPEPASLMALGLGAAALVRRRKR